MAVITTSSFVKALTPGVKKWFYESYPHHEMGLELLPVDKSVKSESPRGIRSQKRVIHDEIRQIY